MENFKEPGQVQASLMEQLAAIEREHGVAPEFSTAPGRFLSLLRALHGKAGQPVAVLVDEYDKPILDALEVPEVARANRDFLRGTLRGRQGRGRAPPVRVFSPG